MLAKEDTITVKPLDTIDTLVFYFFRWSRLDWTARLSRCYQHSIYEQEIMFDHLAIGFGNHVYEVSLEGTTEKFARNDFEQIAYSSPDLVAVYSIDLSDFDDERKRATEMMLNSDVEQKRSFDRWGVIRYFRHLRFSGMTPLNSFRNHVLKPGTARKISRYEYEFNLPYTCATQAANVIYRMFDIDAACDACLPTSIACCAEVLSTMGYGSLWLKY